MREVYEGKRTRGLSRRSLLQLALAGAALLAAVALTVVLAVGGIRGAVNPKQESLQVTTPPTQQDGAQTTQGTPETEAGNILWEEPEPPATYEEFHPYAVESTQPSKYISFTEVLSGGNITAQYQTDTPISFGLGSNYGALDGILAFRGDNFRSGSSFGVADLTQKTFGDYWTQPVTSLTSSDGTTWSGAGWTGQPLIVTWPKETRQIMNLHDWAKAADALTEVIYATMDGNIYFLELTTGKQTRDPLFMGYTFKGSGSLDPRGYPILYVGAGYDSSLGRARAFVISLIDFSVLYEFGANDSFALRDWSCFDASPLIDAETDQLIYPGESGLLYLVKLNTSYDEAAGTLSMNPETVRWRYQGTRSSSQSYWLGMEDSAVIWQGHIIMSDNGGNLMCLDLNTLTLDWVQDVLDDTNCSPVLSLEDGHPYVYISTSFHLGWRSSSTADIPIYKIDAETGEIVWEYSYNCYSESGVSGGVQGTIALGQKQLSGMVYVPVARANTPGGGILAAFDGETGALLWEHKTDSYSWGSPTIVYDKAGNGYLVFATLLGELQLVDGATGQLLDTMDLGAHVESTAAVYENTVVIGTRTNYIYGITLE